MLKVFKDFKKLRTFEDLYLSVFLVGPAHDLKGMPQLFAKAGCKKAESLKDADLVVFAGGEDISPDLYGAEKHLMTSYSYKRDRDDIQVFMAALDMRIPMVGICRGAQFLHVMNGGVLYQHVDNHNGNHSIWDEKLKKTINKVSSVHHQMCKSGNKGMDVIATSVKSENRFLDNTRNDGPGNTFAKTADVEAFYYGQSCCLGVQGHPEYYDYDEYAEWFIQYVFEMYNSNPDVYLNDRNFYRHKKRYTLHKDLQKKVDAILKTEPSKNPVVLVGE